MDYSAAGPGRGGSLTGLWLNDSDPVRNVQGRWG